MNALVQRFEERIAADDLRDAELAETRARLAALVSTPTGIDREAYCAAVAEAGTETAGNPEDARR